MVQGLTAVFVFAAVLTLLTLSFTLTSNTLDAPNFSTGALMGLGSYVTQAVKEHYGYPIYLGLPFGFVLGSILSWLSFRCVFYPLLTRKRKPVQITIASIGLQVALVGVVQVLFYFLRTSKFYYNMSSQLIEYDFRVGQYSGIFFVSSVIAFGLYLLSRIVQHKPHGITLTSFFENLELVQVQGVDTIRVGSVIWLVSGGLAGLAGSILPIHFQIAPNYGYWVMFSVIAAALIGGMGDMAGTFLGATIMSIIEIGGVLIVQSLGAVWFGEYRYLLPIAVISLMMYFKSNGLKGRDA